MDEKQRRKRWTGARHALALVLPARARDYRARPGIEHEYEYEHDWEREVAEEKGA